MTETQAGVKVEKGIPIPPRSLLQGRKSQFEYSETLKTMAVEESFAVLTTPEEGYDKIAGRISSMIQREQKIGDKRFTWRRVEEEGREGVRVWRVK